MSDADLFENPPATTPLDGATWVRLLPNCGVYLHDGQRTSPGGWVEVPIHAVGMLNDACLIFDPARPHLRVHPRHAENAGASSADLPEAMLGMTWLRLPVGVTVAVDGNARMAPGGWIEIPTSEVEAFCAAGMVF